MYQFEAKNYLMLEGRTQVDKIEVDIVEQLTPFTLYKQRIAIETLQKAAQKTCEQIAIAISKIKTRVKKEK